MDDKVKNSLEAAQLYYMEDFSQSQIAKRMSISNATVSRLLQFARDKGIVKISIDNPLYDAEEISTLLSNYYDLPIQVVPDMYGGENKALDSLGLYVAEYLAETIESGDIIGIGWGKTIKAVADQMKLTTVENVQVVMLKGTTSLSYEENFAYDSIYDFARSFHTEPNFLPLPTIFDSAQTKKLVEQDRFIKNILELGQAANVALYTVGTVKKDALLFQLGYLTNDQIRELQDEAVGDILSHFVDSDLDIVSEELDCRTVGISLEELGKKDRGILVAAGARKLAAVEAVLRAKYCTEAVIDMAIGISLAEQIEKEKKEKQKQLNRQKS